MSSFVVWMVPLAERMRAFGPRPPHRLVCSVAFRRFCLSSRRRAGRIRRANLVYEHDVSTTHTRERTWITFNRKDMLLQQICNKSIPNNSSSPAGADMGRGADIYLKLVYLLACMLLYAYIYKNFSSSSFNRAGRLTATH